VTPLFKELAAIAIRFVLIEEAGAGVEDRNADETAVFEQASMIRRYIMWHNDHACDEWLRNCRTSPRTWPAGW
jgi:hypothetical protein